MGRFRTNEYFIAQIAGGSDSYNSYTIGEVCRRRNMEPAVVPNKIFLQYFNTLLTKICKIKRLYIILKNVFGQKHFMTLSILRVLCAMGEMK